jgi:carbonic anhydrase
MEKHYAFIKNNRVENILVFASQDEELADRVAQEQGYDDAVWVGENIPARWSTYNGSTFTPPTSEYLISIGVLTPTQE